MYAVITVMRDLLSSQDDKSDWRGRTQVGGSYTMPKSMGTSESNRAIATAVHRRTPKQETTRSYTTASLGTLVHMRNNNQQKEVR